MGQSSEERKAYQINYRETNREKAKEYARQYRAAHPGKAQEDNKRYYGLNREKVLEQNRIYCRENRAKITEMRRLYRNRNQEKIRAIRRKAQTGFTKDLFEERIRLQDGKCSICHLEFDSFTDAKRNADHNHQTNQPRGILCTRCNVMLGMAQDNKTVLAEAVKYLDLWETP